jgi:ribosomal protein L9
VVYAATGTINTSDRNEKQDIEELSDSERRVATRIKNLVRKFKFKDAVAEKGNTARIHFGVIAQDVQEAFAAEGLDAYKYGLFCSDTYKTINGKAVSKDKETGEYPEGSVDCTRLGVRYEELLCFVISSI